jgi:hypothetical protein
MLMSANVDVFVFPETAPTIPGGVKLDNILLRLDECLKLSALCRGDSEYHQHNAMPHSSYRHNSMMPRDTEQNTSI